MLTSPRMSTGPGDLIRLSEGAALVRMHPRTLRRWIAQGKLTGWRMASNQIRVSHRELLGLVEPMPPSQDLNTDGVA